MNAKSPATGPNRKDGNGYNLTLRPDVVQALDNYTAALSEKLGFKVSRSQAISYLINNSGGMNAASPTPTA